MSPSLSILLPAMKGYASVATALAAWDAQTFRSRLEIVVLCPAGLGPAPGAGDPARCLNSLPARGNLPLPGAVYGGRDGLPRGGIPAYFALDPCAQ